MTKLALWRTYLCAFPCVTWQKNVCWNLDVHPSFILVVMATDSHCSVLMPERVPPKPMWKPIISVGHPWSFHLMLMCDCCSLSWRGWMWVTDVALAVTRRQIEHFFWRRPLPQGGLVCWALTERSCWSALTDATEGTRCGNELLIPEGRAGEITLIWTLLLWLIFVMQSCSVAMVHRWLWIMALPLSACPRTPLIVLSRALQPSPGQQHTE